MTREFQKSFAGGGCAAAARRSVECAQGLTVEDAFALPPLAAATPSGAPVVIFQIDRTGRVFIEGLACKGVPTSARRFEHWVTFVGESRPRRRVVLPGAFQMQADAIVDGLQALYEQASALDIPDIFLSDLLKASAANDNRTSDEERAKGD